MENEMQESITVNVPVKCGDHEGKISYQLIIDADGQLKTQIRLVRDSFQKEFLAQVKP